MADAKKSETKPEDRTAKLEAELEAEIEKIKELMRRNGWSVPEKE